MLKRTVCRSCQLSIGSIAKDLQTFWMKGTLKVSAYQDILDNFMLPTLWEHFGDDPF
ncbi:unnamed protein product, partial [Staurois parvus]